MPKSRQHGTPLSSLAYVWKLPVDIDRSLVCRMVDDERDRKPVHSIVRISQDLR